MEDAAARRPRRRRLFTVEALFCARGQSAHQVFVKPRTWRELRRLGVEHDRSGFCAFKYSCHDFGLHAWFGKNTKCSCIGQFLANG